MKSIFNTFSKLKLPAALAIALGLGGCASDRMDGFMNEKTRGLPLLGGTGQRTFNEDAAKSAALTNGLNNPNSVTREMAEAIICQQNNAATEPVKTRSRWAEASGRKPELNCKP